MKKHLFFVLLFAIIYNFSTAQITYGIDVSADQGTISWPPVYSNPKYFSFVRFSLGYNTADANRVTNMNAGQAAGLKMGAYHIGYPNNNSAQTEAQYFLGLASTYIVNGYLPPALDMEPTEIDAYMNEGYTWSDVATWIQTWSLYVYNNGSQRWPVLYLTGYYATNLAPYYGNIMNSGIKLWIADYPNSNPGNPSVPSGWPWLFEQYSETGSVSGISGNVDLDDFNGSIASLDNLAGNTCAPPANDNCPGTAITSNGACLNGTVACATGSYGANLCSGCSCTSPDDYDVYYSFVAQATTETVTVSNYASNFNVVIELRTACALGSGNYLGCYDPGTPTSTSYSWANLTVGQTYYVRVFDYDYSGNPPSSPTFTICVKHTACSPPTNISFSGTLSACSGRTSFVSVSASNCNGCTFQWSGGLGSGSSENLTPGSYTVTATSSCEGSATGSVTISTLSNPNTPTITAAGSCSPVSITANSNSCSGCSYNWSTPSGSNSGATISGTSSGTYYTTVTNSNSCTASNSQSITVNQIPSANISPSSVSICNGTSTTLTASGGGSYSWNTGATTAAITVNPSTNTTYTVSVTLNGCIATASRTVTVGSPPTVNITPATVTICNGGNTTITASGGGTYSWSNSETTAAITVNPSTTTAYTVTVTSNGCIITASRTVIVNSIPSASISPSIVTICSGQNATITAGGGGTYTWSNSLGSNAQVSVSPSSNITYFVTVTNANNCTASASRTVTVNPVPSANISPTSISICSGTNATLTAGGGGTYVWSNSLGSNAQISVSPNSPTIYTVTITSAANCSASASASVAVNITPNPPTFSPASGCSPITVAANSTNCNGCSYQWSTGSTSDTSVYTSTTNYIVTATSNSNCSATGSGTITVNGQPSVSLISSGAGICQGNTDTLSTNPTASSYSWSGPNNYTANAPQITISNVGLYSVTVTNPGSCNGTATASYTIIRYNSPVADAGGEKTNTGTGVAIGGNPTASGGQSPYSYSWTPTGTLNNSSVSNPFANPTSTTTYTVIVADNNNCTASDNMVVSVSGNCSSYILSSSNVNVPASSGIDSVMLMTGVSCQWSITGGCSWVIINNISGAGSATISFSYQENPLPSTRTCFINIQGNIFTVTQAPSVGCAPVADFSDNSTAGFAPFTTSFIDNSTNATQWEWTFPGGSPPTSIVQNPTVTYNNGGIYDVTLKVTNTCGADSIVKAQYINVLSASSVENVSAIKNISILPNPNNGTFTVRIEVESNEKIWLNLFNAIGQLVTKRGIIITNSIAQEDFDLSNSAKGIYYIQILAEGKYFYLKVAVE